jgi:hypothetical protein
MTLPRRLGSGAGADVGNGGADAPARSELMATGRAAHIGDETLLTTAGGLVVVRGWG